MNALKALTDYGAEVFVSGEAPPGTPDQLVVRAQKKLPDGRGIAAQRVVPDELPFDEAFGFVCSILLESLKRLEP